MLIGCGFRADFAGFEPVTCVLVVFLVLAVISFLFGTVWVVVGNCAFRPLVLNLIVGLWCSVWRVSADFVSYASFFVVLLMGLDVAVADLCGLFGANCFWVCRFVRCGLVLLLCLF